MTRRLPRPRNRREPRPPRRRAMARRRTGGDRSGTCGARHAKSHPVDRERPGGGSGREVMPCAPTILTLAASPSWSSACGGGGEPRPSSAAGGRPPASTTPPRPTHGSRNPAGRRTTTRATRTRAPRWRSTRRPDEDRVSTFALDVDTASYTIARATSDEGYLPDPAGVRVEEFVNAFQQGYPRPRTASPSTSTAGRRRMSTDELSAVGLRERRRDRARGRSLTFVIDTSGSMEREARLELVKDALAGSSTGWPGRHRRDRHLRRRRPGPARRRRGRRRASRSWTPSTAASRWLDQPRGRAPAGLRAGPRDPHRERHRPRRARLGRRRQRRPDRPEGILSPVREDAARASSSSRSASAWATTTTRCSSSWPTRATASTPTSTSWTRPSAVRHRGPDRHPPDGRARRQGPGRVRPRRVAAYRLLGYENRDHRRHDSGTTRSMPARSGPATR